MSVEPFVDQGMSHRFRLLTVAVYDFSGHFNVPRMDRYDPLVSLNPSADGVSYTSVLHATCCTQIRNLAMLCADLETRRTSWNKANICRDEADASAISSEHGDPLLRFLDLPAQQVTKVWSSISGPPEGAPSRWASSIDW